MQSHDAAVAAAEHRCELLSRALEESETIARESEARAVAAELSAEAAAEAETRHQRGLATISETWKEQQ